MSLPSLSTDLRAAVRRAVPDGVPRRMLPAEAYTSADVLAWELRHLYAGSWVCLGREAELLPSAVGTTGGRPDVDGAADGDRPVLQRAARVGDVGVLLVREGARVRMFANACRHRGHELLPDGETSARQTVMCPYHAWTYRLDGSVLQAPGFRRVDGFDPAEHGLVELPLERWCGWVFAHALHPAGDPAVPAFDLHLGALAAIVEPYHPERLVVTDRHLYTVPANWKVLAENYHECYHCPLIHPELCQVTPPDSGDNYDLPGAWVGGAMTLREGVRSMTSDGGPAAHALPGVDPTRVEYLHLLPNLFVSPHPDYVMTHRLVPLAPDRTWVECSWLVLPDPDGRVPAARTAVEFWDRTNRQDWAACASVQRGLANPHVRPGPFAPNEDAVAHLVRAIAAAYLAEETDAGPSPGV